MTKTPYLKTHFFILICLWIVLPSISFAQFTQKQQLEAIERQDRIIRQKQEIEKEKRKKREFEKIRKERELLKKLKQEQEKDKKKSTKENYCFNINSIELLDVESLSKRQIAKITNPFLGKCFQSTTLTNIIAKINSFYRNKGYTTVQTTIPKQNITNGHLKLQITEGRIGKIVMGQDKFTDKMQEFTAFGFLEGNILNINDINQGIYQINRLFSNNAAMRIEPGEKEGESKVLINNEKKFPARATLSYNNLGNEFTGIRRVNFSGSMDNLLSLNDQINLSYNANLDDPSKEKDLRSFTSSISIPFVYNTFFYDYSRTKFGGTNPGQNGPLRLTGYSNRNNFAIDRVLINNVDRRISGNISLTTKETASYLNKNKIEASERKLTIANLSFAISNYFKNGANLYLKPQYSRGLKLLNAKQDNQNLALLI